MPSHEILHVAITGEAQPPLQAESVSKRHRKKERVSRLSCFLLPPQSCCCAFLCFGASTTPVRAPGLMHVFRKNSYWLLVCCPMIFLLPLAGYPKRKRVAEKTGKTWICPHAGLPRNMSKAAKDRKNRIEKQWNGKMKNIREAHTGLPNARQLEGGACAI